MNPSTYIPIIFLWLIIFILFRNRRKAAIMNKIIRERKIRGKTDMKELATRFIGKECLISSFDGSKQYEGIIKEVTDGAILLEKDGKSEAFNLDFVIRIREYPRDKNGKKKSFIYD